MRKNLLIAISLALCAVVPSVSLAGKLRIPSCGQDETTLKVTISDGLAYNITPDLGGEYSKTKTNKVDVKFQIDNCSFDLTMNLAFSSRTINVSGLPIDKFPPNGSTTSSGFNFDRIASVPITDGGSVFMEWCNGGVQKESNGAIKFDTDYNIYRDNYAPCDYDGAGWFARRHVGFSLNNAYALRFQNSPIENGNGLDNDTVFIKVYHPSNNTWELEPDTVVYRWNSYPTGNFLPTDFLSPLGISGSPVSALIYINGRGSVNDWPIMPFKIVVTKP